MGAVTSFFQFVGLGRKKYEFFISYASSDSAVVHPLCKIIGATKKNSFFIDAYELEPGKLWTDELAKAIRSCDTVFVFWSKNSASSEWVKAEYEVAITRRKNIVPIILDKTRLPDLLDGYQSIKFSDRNIEEKEVSNIFERIDRQKTKKRLNEFRAIALACIMVGGLFVFVIPQSGKPEGAITTLPTVVEIVPKGFNGGNNGTKSNSENEKGIVSIQNKRFMGIAGGGTFYKGPDLQAVEDSTAPPAYIKLYNQQAKLYDELRYRYSLIEGNASSPDWKEILNSMNSIDNLIIQNWREFKTFQHSTEVGELIEQYIREAKRRRSIYREVLDDVARRTE